MIFSVFLNTELNDLVPTHYVESYEKLGKLVQKCSAAFHAFCRVIYRRMRYRALKHIESLRNADTIEQWLTSSLQMVPALSINK